MDIAAIQRDIVSEFSALNGWEERYKRIIELGKTLPPFPEAYRTGQNKVRGCQSQVWMHARMDGGSVRYDIDSDAMIVKGLAAILKRVFDAQPITDIVGAPMEFLGEIGLTSHLSQSRANGLAAMTRQFKNYAIAFQALGGLKK